MSDWQTIVDGMPTEARRALLAALLGQREGDPVALLDQRLVATPGDTLEREYPVEQWRGADGTPYGVVIRALRFRDRMEAEREATVTGKAGKTEIDPWRLMAEEVARGIVKPRVTVDQLLGWNDAVVREIYQAIHDLAPYPPAVVAAELARLAGQDAPEPRRGGGDAHADGPGGDGGGAPRAAARRPRKPRREDAGDGDRGGAVAPDA